MDEINKNANKFEDEASMELDESHNLDWHNHHSTVSSQRSRTKDVGEDADSTIYSFPCSASPV